MTKKWDSLWLGANIATLALDNTLGIIHDAAIASQNGKICFIGPSSSLPDTAANLATSIYNVQHRWITPGLIDCHTHLIYAGNRANEFTQRLQGVSYTDIAKQGGGILATVKATRLASEQQLLDLALQRLRYWQREGVTTVEIKSGYGLTKDSELKMLRVARQLATIVPLNIISTCLAAHTIPPEFKHNPDAYIDLIINEILPVVAKEKLADAVDAFCESIAFSPAQVARVFQAANDLGLPVKCHAEQLSCSHSVAMTAQYRALSCEHLEYIDDAGIKALAQNNMIAVLLPAAYYYLQETTIPPINKLKQHNIPIAIASDSNPGSAPIYSLLSTMNMACVLWRMTPTEVLRGVTINAANALGIGDDVGSLEIDKRADFVVWDIDAPTELCYALGRNPCLQVIKSGQIITDDQ